MEADEVISYNEEFYNTVWKNVKITSHEMWPIWKAIGQNINDGAKILEIGPGTRPRIPVKNSYFIELSSPAAELLRKNGGKAESPFNSKILQKKEFFDIVCAFEVLEHIPDDKGMLRKISRIMKQNGKLFISVPVHMKHWTELDKLVGHHRRYNPAVLQKQLEDAGFEMISYAEDKFFSRIYSAKLLQKIAKYFLIRFPKLSARIETRGLKLMCALARRFSPIEWKQGKLAEVRESTVGIYAVCRKV